MVNGMQKIANRKGLGIKLYDCCDDLLRDESAMLVRARLRHVAGTQWGNKKYMNMKHVEVALEDASIAG